MYETPSRSNSNSSRRRPPTLHAPSLNPLVPSAGVRGLGATPGGSNGSGGSSGSGSGPSMGPGSTGSLMMSPGSPVTPYAPQTPQQRLMLRKPMSMQTLNTARSSTRLSTPRSAFNAGIGGLAGFPNVSEVYKGKIHVGVRAKPELSGAVGGPWLLVPENNVVDHDTAGNFHFDKVYDGKSTNDEVFEESVNPLIQQVVDGYNATVFAYGTTGSGKTFTMQGSETDPGVIQRSVHQLFSLLEQKGTNALVRLSYFEIYNERVYDLLAAESNKPVEVMLRDGSMGDTRVVGQREVDTRSARDLLQWVANGDQLRRTSSTQYNEHSSRSHAVVRIQVLEGSMQSILYLCDLAGSERAVVHTERRKEGSFINKSLLTLSTVISILSQGGGGHVPYRDSKLTRLLQPSLSGTALVAMLCTIQTGPPPAGGAETVNSVRFAAKAKNITVMAKRSSVFDDGLGAGNAVSARMIEQLQLENESLRREASKLRTERDDMQDRLAVYDAADAGDLENSLEAMSGISFADGEDSVVGIGGETKTPTSDASTARLRKELSWYKEENDKLHQRVSHLVSEITALDANIANLETAHNSASPTLSLSSATSPETTSNAGSLGDSDAGLREEIKELKEQLKDRDLLIACLTSINNSRDKISSEQSPGRSTAEAIQDLRI